MLKRKYLLSIVMGMAVVLLLATTPIAAQEDSLPDLGGQTIQAVTENLFPPLNLERSDTGAGVGMEYDLVEEICSLLNCTVEWSLISFDAMIAAVGDGQFDVGMDGITITEEREEIVDFSNKYITFEQFLMVRADEDRFSNAEELGANEELLIGAQPGTTPFFTAIFGVLDGDFENPRVVQFDRFAFIVQALRNGDVDAMIIDDVGGAGVIGQFPGELKIVGDALQSEDFGLIFPNDSELVDPFNQALAVLEADGYLDYLKEKWLSRFDINSQGFRAEG